MFLVLDATPAGQRYIEDADTLIRDAGMCFLAAWGEVMEVFHTGAEPWAADAATSAALAYRDHLDALAPMLQARGRA